MLQVWSHLCSLESDFKRARKRAQHSRPFPCLFTTIRLVMVSLLLAIASAAYGAAVASAFAAVREQDHIFSQQVQARAAVAAVRADAANRASSATSSLLRSSIRSLKNALDRGGHSEVGDAGASPWDALETERAIADATLAAAAAAADAAADAAASAMVNFTFEANRHQVPSPTSVAEGTTGSNCDSQIWPYTMLVTRIGEHIESSPLFWLKQWAQELAISAPKMRESTWAVTSTFATDTLHIMRKTLHPTILSAAILDTAAVSAIADSVFAKARAATAGIRTIAKEAQAAARASGPRAFALIKGVFSKRPWLYSTVTFCALVLVMGSHMFGRVVKIWTIAIVTIFTYWFAGKLLKRARRRGLSEEQEEQALSWLVRGAARFCAILLALPLPLQ